jgi:nucleotide-binding universal stress UspA family protein
MPLPRHHRPPPPSTDRRGDPRPTPADTEEATRMNPTSTNAGHRTVVVGIDGRPATLRAAVWAAREATRRDATLTLVAVAGGARMTPEADLAQARRIVARDIEIPVVEELSSGPVGSTLIAASRRAELLVVGARTPDGHVDETVGATTTQVLTRADCPVVVVPAAWEADRRHEGQVVVAADPADPHGAAHGSVALAVDVAVRWGVPLLASVVLPREPGHREVARGHRMLDVVFGGLAASHDALVVDQMVRHGEPAVQLLDLVGPSSGLLVLGAQGSASSLSTLGPTCEGVVRWARCPVAVVPPGIPGVRPHDLRPVVAGGAA